MEDFIKTFLETLFIGIIVTAIIIPNKILGIFL